MERILTALNSFWGEEEGQDLVEYALLLAFIALAAVAILTSLGTGIGTLFKDISNSVSKAATTAS